VSADIDQHNEGNESGAVMVEMTATIVLFLTVLLGVVEFSYVFYQWNAASKATQFGARLAAVSGPVSPNLATWSGLGQTGACANLQPGDAIPVACGYDRVCTTTSATADTVTCTNDTSDATARRDAMRALIFGRAADGTPRTTCDPTVVPRRRMGMCNVFTRLTDARRVQVRYQYTGLGYAGRPDGAVPTVTVQLTGMQFRFVLLSFMFGTIDMPSFTTTVTGEDLDAAWST
jgi:Flp pilus assembly protein TadG